MSGSLVHSPAKITLELLVSAGLGYKVSSTPTDWMVFLNKTQDRKTTSAFDYELDKVITVYDTAGIVDSRAQNTGTFLESHGVSIQLRLNELEEHAGYAKAKQIQDYLDLNVNRYRVMVTDTEETEYVIHSYNRTSDIIRMNNLNITKDDTLKGLRFSLNFLMFVTKV